MGVYPSVREALAATTRSLELALDAAPGSLELVLSRDEWSPEARKAAAESRHLHMSATHESGAGQKFTAKASSHAEVEKHLASMHEHIKKHNLGPHNVSVENKKTGEVHGAKIHPTHGVYKKTYKNLDE